MKSLPRDQKPASRPPRLSVLILIGSLLGLAALIALPRWLPMLLRIEHQTSDWRTALLSDKRSDLHPGMAVVLIGEETLADYPYMLPIDRSLLAKTIRALEEARVRAIGIDLYFAKRTEKEKDEALLAVLKERGDTGIVLGALDERGRLTESERAFQSSFLEATQRPAGYLNLRIEPDDVVRYRAAPAQGSRTPKSFAEALAELAGVKTIPLEDRIAWLLPPRGQANPFLVLHAEALFDGTKAHEDAVARGEIEALKGRAVLVGGDFPYLDRHLTPLAALGGEKMAGVFVHAHILAQLIDGRAFYEPPARQVRWLLLGVALAAALLGWLFGLRHYHFFGWSVATAILVGVDAVLFSQFRTILPFTLMVMAWVLGAAAGRCLRIVVASYRENARRVP